MTKEFLRERISILLLEMDIKRLRKLYFFIKESLP